MPNITYRIYKVFSSPIANLYTMARPLAGDQLLEDIRGLSDIGVKVLVSCLEPIEVEELELQQEEEWCNKFNMQYKSIPVQDRGVPLHLQQFKEEIEALKRELKRGNSIVVHCRGGIGRSSLVAAAVMLENERTASEVFEHISKIRGFRVPDTEEQVAWFEENFG